MSALFLDQEQLIELTGYRQPKSQIDWLKKNGVRHYIRADGKPSVPLTALQETEKTSERRRPEPNFAALDTRN